MSKKSLGISCVQYVNVFKRVAAAALSTPRRTPVVFLRCALSPPLWPALLWAEPTNDLGKYNSIVPDIFSTGFAKTIFCDF